MPASDPAAIRTIVDYVRDRNAPSQPKAIPSLPNAKAPAPSASGEYVFRHSSHGWEVKYGGQQSIQLPELKGLTLIQTLLRHPGKAISVVDLLQMGAASIVSDARVDSDSMRTTAWEGEPVLDKQAQKDVKAELDRLVAEAELARESGNEERLSELTEEIIAIREHDNRTRGLGGRQRALGSEVEQFRKTARAQYRTALKCLRASLPALAQHLTDNVRSGRRFVYRPPSPLPWET
jgi:uncharacterized protein YihD (DUF1040 family)